LPFLRLSNFVYEASSLRLPHPLPALFYTAKSMLYIMNTFTQSRNARRITLRTNKQHSSDDPATISFTLSCRFVPVDSLAGACRRWETAKRRLKDL